MEEEAPEVGLEPTRSRLIGKEHTFSMESSTSCAQHSRPLTSVSAHNSAEQAFAAARFLCITDEELRKNELVV